MERKNRNSGSSKRTFTKRDSNASREQRYDKPARPRRDDDEASKRKPFTKDDSSQRSDSRPSFNRERPERSSSFGRSENTDRSQRSDRPERSGRPQRPGRGGPHESFGSNRPERSNRYDRDDRPQRDDRPSRPERSDRDARPERSRTSDRDAGRNPRSFSRDRSSDEGNGRPERFSRGGDRDNRRDGGRAEKKLQVEKSPEAKRNGEMRLNRFLANAGLCSRREADTLIQTGLVQINGKIITELGVKVKPDDEIKFNDSIVRRERKVYILLNKPKDFITSADDPEKRRTVFELIKDACPERVFPVGRLDRNTTGVLLFTNDGDLADMLMHPKYSKKKIYHVFLDKKLRPDDYNAISAGIELEDGFVRPDSLEYVDASDHSQVGVEIHSGKNRIVRRIFEHLDYKIEKLDRVYFAGLTKKNLTRGRWRFLSDYEVAMLKKGKFD